MLLFVAAAFATLLKFFVFQFQWLSNTRSSARVNLNWVSILANQKHTTIQKYNTTAHWIRIIESRFSQCPSFSLLSLPNTHNERHNGWIYSQFQISILFNVSTMSQAIEFRFERKNHVLESMCACSIGIWKKCRSLVWRKFNCLSF